MGPTIGIGGQVLARAGMSQAALISALGPYDKKGSEWGGTGTVPVLYWGETEVPFCQGKVVRFIQKSEERKAYEAKHPVPLL
ncbi:MAG TPA: hypothetical protein VGO93_20690 [Candidatus Xenobia bacterium]